MIDRKESILVGYPNIISYNSTEKIIEQMAKNICKIKIGRQQGTGFFCKIPFPDKDNMLSVFITNNHIINEEILNTKDFSIKLDIKEEKNYKIINLNDRIIYTNKAFDITIIEIKENDGIENYLELDDIIIKDILEDNIKIREYIDKTTYIIQYPDGDLSVSYGIIDNVYEDNNFTFIHKCSTRNGSSGSPILNINNNKIIGIHKECHNNQYNLGTFLNFPIKELIRSNNKLINDKKYFAFSKHIISQRNSLSASFTFNINKENNLYKKQENQLTINTNSFNNAGRNPGHLVKKHTKKLESDLYANTLRANRLSLYDEIILKKKFFNKNIPKQSKNIIKSRYIRKFITESRNKSNNFSADEKIRFGNQKNLFKKQSKQIKIIKYKRKFHLDNDNLSSFMNKKLNIGFKYDKSEKNSLSNMNNLSFGCDKVNINGRNENYDRYSINNYNSKKFIFSSLRKSKNTKRIISLKNNLINNHMLYNNTFNQNKNSPNNTEPNFRVEIYFTSKKINKNKHNNNSLVNEKKFSGHKILKNNLKLILEKMKNETKNSSSKPILTPVKNGNNTIKYIQSFTTNNNNVINNIQSSPIKKNIINCSINISKNSDLHDNLGNKLMSQSDSNFYKAPIRNSTSSVVNQ